jgi:hypothetical protein
VLFGHGGNHAVALTTALVTNLPILVCWRVARLPAWVSRGAEKLWVPHPRVLCEGGSDAADSAIVAPPR